MTIETISEHRCFGGTQGFYRHASTACAGPMRFSVYRPPQAARGHVPTLFFLAGLTCTEETFMIKAGAQKIAAELGIMLVAPDTSPREPRLPGDDADWDFGQGAGFYLDATQAPWAAHYRLHDYVSRELPEIVEKIFPADPRRFGIFGHSMGGHGALVLGLRHPQRFRSLSAFAPISSPSQVPWGIKAFTNYLGPDRATWAEWDANALVRKRPYGRPILIDQGLADKFLETQLKPELFEAACETAGQKLMLRRHEGYDHGYYFIESFIEDHLRHHAAALAG
ncbi:S-formylglutathione hydrolase [Hypericibacter sp.]|uniref:S-formylglutathione hydrolase n=1 Tax=Hypericibacter sp. TaxID=2705401 RepID=UPI003D6D648A